MHMVLIDELIRVCWTEAKVEECKGYFCYSVLLGFVVKRLSTNDVITSEKTSLL